MIQLKNNGNSKYKIDFVLQFNDETERLSEEIGLLGSVYGSGVYDMIIKKIQDAMREFGEPNCIGISKK